MLDLGWSELLVIAIAALIVVGPKDLPRMLRTLGQYAAKARGVAREFQRALDEAAREADIEELKEVKKSLDEVRDVQYAAQRELGQSFLDAEKRDAAKPKAKTGATPSPSGAPETPDGQGADGNAPAAPAAPAASGAPTAPARQAAGGKTGGA